MKMYTFFELESIGADGEPTGVAIACADSEEEAIEVIIAVCRGWRNEAVDALRKELKRAELITDATPYAFLSSRGGG